MTGSALPEVPKIKPPLATRQSTMVPSNISDTSVQRTSWPSFSNSYITIHDAPEPWVYFPPPPRAPVRLPGFSG